MQLITLDGLRRFKEKIDELFVSKEYKTGSDTEYRTLSDNNLTDELVEKINASGAAVEVTEEITTAKTEAVTESKEYTDTAKTEAITESNSYTDTEVAEAKTEAVTTSNSYTDTEVSEALNEAKSYADTAEADAVASAKTYTDETAATAKTEAVTASNSYTDTEVSEALTEAKAYADTAESDAVATANTYTNEQVAAAKTELQTEINSKISTAYKVKGSSAFASLPTPSEAEEGYVWNITDQFTTTDVFVEGAGKKYPAGTNIVCIEESEGVFKFDILPGFIDTDSFVLCADIVQVTESEIDALFA